MTRIPLTIGQIREHVSEQLELLVTYCEQFDAGNRVMAKPLATALRVLFHTANVSRSPSKALLDQAGLRSVRWLDTAGPPPNEAGISWCGLVLFKVEGSPAQPSSVKGFCDPKYYRSDAPATFAAFPRWWGGPVAKNAWTNKTFSRMDIVKHVANTDGGAHVDPTIDKSFSELREGTFTGIRFVKGSHVIGLNIRADSTEGELIEGAHLAALRTIAHEVLLSLDRTAPELFRREYAPRMATGNRGRGHAARR